MKETPQKSYYAIIPADVRYNKNLTANAKLMYGEITALCNEKGYCWASNKYFADLYKKAPETISRWVSSLCEQGYIEYSFTYKSGSKEIDKRVITLLTKKSIPSPQKNQGGIDKNVKDNTTYTNNTINSKYMSEIKISDVPLEFQEYFEIAEAFRNLFIKNLKEAGAGTKHQDKAKFKDYAGQIRLMFKNDDATKEQFQKVFIFLGSPQGEFWKPNILSIKKLREKFSKLVMDANKLKPKVDKRAAVVQNNSNWNV